jgi:hypothetical protein
MRRLSPSAIVGAVGRRITRHRVFERSGRPVRRTKTLIVEIGERSDARPVATLAERARCQRRLCGGNGEKTISANVKDVGGGARDAGPDLHVIRRQRHASAQFPDVIRSFLRF